MRACLSSDGCRGNVEPRGGLAIERVTLRAEARVCAPPKFVDLPAGVGLPLLPNGVWR